MRLATAFAVLAFAGPAFAADDIADCGGSNVEMTECVIDHYKAADAELNRVWKQVMATFDGDPADPSMPKSTYADWKKVLIDAQRAWATYKDKDCNGAVNYEYYGGTGAGAAVGQCLYDKTEARIAELKARYLGDDGGAAPDDSEDGATVEPPQ
ncbi:MAG TPA: lysozyme inhibitor LprI family protein [Bauldia sp.]|nr:lysozyme inhibitor LprI family protein [Bauldia sp.]